MTRMLLAGLLAASLGGCSGDRPAPCPAFDAVAPPILGPGFMPELSNRLAGPDRENGIDEAIAEIHRKDPSLDSDAITNILIAADCPNAAARSPEGTRPTRDRIAQFRAQVDQLIGQFPQD